MRAIQFAQTGGPEVLKLVELPTPRPGPGEILIRNQAIGVNFIDIYQRAGLYPMPLPSGLGLEAAGVVEAIGDGVTRFSVGDAVATSTGQPTYADYTLLPEGQAVRVPPGIDPQTAAAVMLKGTTSEFLIRRLYRVEAGQTVLVHAAAGGVGQILVQWLKALGAKVIGTVGSEEKATYVKALGADHVILYRSEDVAARVREITRGAGVAVAYDSVGKDTFAGTLASLARRGMFVSFGNASGPAPPIDPLQLMRAGSLFFTRPTIFDYQTTPEELDASASALFNVVLSGLVKVEIDHAYPLANAGEAHTALASRNTIGASLLIP